MANISKGGRSYSDPSYGSVKQTEPFTGVTAGTRATALVESVKMLQSVTVVDWNIVNSALGTGGSSQWVLAATSANGTGALGTIVLVGTHAAGATVDGAISGAAANIASGGRLDFYSVLSTAADLSVKPRVSYRERFEVSEN
jgi:hypothetical protein